MKTDIKVGDLVWVDRSTFDSRTEDTPGVVVGIECEWDDGEPPGMFLTTWIEILFGDGTVETWDSDIVNHLGNYTGEWTGE
jgi:hypothetical protein